MSSFTNRFHAVQKRAADVLSAVSLTRLVAVSHTRNGNEDERVAGFLALQFITYAGERAVSGLLSLRKIKSEAPTITPDDYERFIERCFGIASAMGVSSDKVADALIREAELACVHAEDAMTRAQTFYSDAGLSLVG